MSVLGVQLTGKHEHVVVKRSFRRAELDGHGANGHALERGSRIRCAVVRTMTSLTYSRNRSTSFAERLSNINRWRNVEYVSSKPGFNRVIMLYNSSRSFWMGVAVSSSKYFLRRLSTKRQAAV